MQFCDYARVGSWKIRKMHFFAFFLKFQGHRHGKPSHLEISAEPYCFTFFCRDYNPFHLVPMLPFMCEHNTESYELTGFFKKNAKKK